MPNRLPIRNTRALCLFILLVIVSSRLSGDEPEVYLSIRLLSTQTSNQIVTTAVADCDRRGFRVSAAVVDRNGNLAAYLRHPLAGPHTIEVSQQKAWSAATLQAATSDMSHRPDLSFAPGMLLIVGGVPIQFNGHFYGGAAVAGAPPEIDEQCALAGINAITETMEFAD